MLGKTIEVKEGDYTFLIPVNKISFARTGTQWEAGPGEGRFCLLIWTIFPDRPIFIYDMKEIDRVWNLLSSE